jgi:hypothetical protein
VLLPGETLFLGGGENETISDYHCRAVMVEAGYAQNIIIFQFVLSFAFFTVLILLFETFV